MSKQDSLKKGEQAQKVKLSTIMEGQTFYLIAKNRLEVKSSSAPEFDTWAVSFVEEITNVDRNVWDVFARWRFINFLIAEDILQVQQEEDGTIVLVETEEKTSVDISDEPTSQAS